MGKSGLDKKSQTSSVTTHMQAVQHFLYILIINIIILVAGVIVINKIIVFFIGYRVYLYSCIPVYLYTCSPVYLFTGIHLIQKEGMRVWRRGIDTRSRTGTCPRQSLPICPSKGQSETKLSNCCLKLFETREYFTFIQVHTGSQLFDSSIFPQLK